jgi:hypothetical protein
MNDKKISIRWMAEFYQNRISALEATKRGIEKRNPFAEEELRKVSCLRNSEDAHRASARKQADELIQVTAQIETLRGVTDDLYFQLAR